MKKDITLIIGPTAIGKSDLAIEYAKKNNSEIISADAFQVYKYMDIGTAKVPLTIRNKIPHHLIDIKEPNESYSVAEFLSLSEKIITNLRKKNTPIIICGGTGMYINAFLYNYKFQDKTENPKLREKIQKEAEEIGPIKLWEKLNNIDPKSANIIDPNNVRRTIRALEVYYQTDTLPSKIRTKSASQRQDVNIIGLSSERKTIVERINIRVDQMIENGLIEEVKNILDMAYDQNAQAFEALGYKETIKYLNGSITKEEMINLIKVKTRQFAKRQMTWFKKIENIQWHNII
jgi:tRNA dimethylallyltransferase